MAIKPKNLFTYLSDLEVELSNFSFEELTSDEASELKKTFQTFKDDLEKKFFGEQVTFGKKVIADDFKKKANKSKTLRIAIESYEIKNHTEQANNMQSESHELMHIIIELLKPSNLSVESSHFETIGFDFHKLVNDITYICKILIVDSNIELNVRMDRAIPKMLIGDPSKLFQVILNKICNSIKVIEKGSIQLQITQIGINNKEIILDFDVEITENNLLNIEVYEEEIFNMPQKNEMDDILLEFEKHSEETSINDDITETSFLPLVVEDNKNTIISKTLYLDENVQDKYSKNIFDNNFFEQDNYNKILLLDTIEDIGSDKDIPFIKEIVEKEENGLIKERALEILNDFSKTTYYFNEEEKTLEENIDNGHSIFKKLFDSCDKESKLLLLDEILEIGDGKEISFLNTLLSHKDNRIKEKAKAVKIELKKREQFINVTEKKSSRHFLNEEAEFIFPLADNEIALIQTIEYTSATIEKKAKVEPFKGKELIPMEFSFLLNELEIKLAGSSSIFDIDFELTNEFYKKQEPIKKTNKNRKK